MAEADTALHVLWNLRYDSSFTPDISRNVWLFSWCKPPFLGNHGQTGIYTDLGNPWAGNGEELWRITKTADVHCLQTCTTWHSLHPMDMMVHSKYCHIRMQDKATCRKLVTR